MQVLKYFAILSLHLLTINITCYLLADAVYSFHTFTFVPIFTATYLNFTYASGFGGPSRWLHVYCLQTTYVYVYACSL